MLGNRDHALVLGGIPVDSSRGGKDNVFDVIFFHCSEQCNCATDIDAVVLYRLLGRLSDRL